MKVRGDCAPINAYTLEDIPKKPGYALIRFYEHPEEFTEEQGGITVHGWKWDEYHLEAEKYDNLANDIFTNYAGCLAQAKLEEAEKQVIPTLKAQVKDLTNENVSLSQKLTDTELALVDVYEIVIGRN